MVELRRFLQRACWLLTVGGTWEFLARSPDAVRSERSEPPWPGETVSVNGRNELYRPLRHYTELARLFPCEIRLPERVEDAAGGDENLLRISGERCAEPLPPEVSPDNAAEVPPQPLDDKYGSTSDYRRFDRLEEPEIVDDLLYGLSRLRLGTARRVLGLGVNDGRELALIAEVLPASGSSRDVSGSAARPELWGIDAAASAIAAAQQRFPAHAERFLCADLATLRDLELPEFDAALLLGVLQCTTVARDRLLDDLKDRLTPKCSLLVSIPNCHFGAGDIRRRPLRRDHPRHDRSLVWKDLRYLARWCYRSGFQHVETFGTYDAFLLARR
ncbi:MAG: hypothetical protein AAF581_09835 [Planctomycetota bacterium]